MTLKKVAAAAALSATAALFTVPASATVWNTTSADNSTADIATAYGNTQSFASGGISLNAKGYSSATGGTSAMLSACLDAFSGGLGVTNRNEDTTASDGCDTSAPDHSTDNGTGGGVDGVLMTFSQAVALTDVSIGWTNGAGSDSDFSVLYYTGAGGPAMNYSSLANMVASGWSLLKNVDGGSANASYSLGNTGSVKSATYWYISAYSSSFGGLANNCDNYDDFFKVNAVTGYKVPEPATLALFGLGLAGMGYVRRRRK